MKRLVLLLFSFAFVATVAYPALNTEPAKTHSAASSTSVQVRNREQAQKDARRKDPHAGLSVQIDTLGETERATRTVTAQRSVGSQTQQTRRPVPIELPPEISRNLIDREIFKVLSQRTIKPAVLATDEEFCRRITLDLTGRQPKPERLQQYVADTDPKKKDKLITELMNSPFFVDRWTMWFGDLTRNYALTGPATDRNGMHEYLRQAVSTNKSVRDLATDVITYEGKASEGPGGFLVRPIFNTEIAQDAYDEMAAETMRTFLGTQAVCVSCHDGSGHLEQVNLYFSTRQRSQYWGLAAFFAQTTFRTNTELNEFILATDRRGAYNADTDNGMRPPRFGGRIEPSFELFRDGKPNAGEDLRKAAARLITSDRQFARAFVNRVFAHFFTVGLVDPVDGFDLARLDPKNPPPAPWELQPSNPVLLEELAKYFETKNYDFRSLITLMVTSKAYALSSQYDESEWKAEYARLYARKLVRRLQAEEVLDAMCDATQKPALYPARGYSQGFSSAMSLPGVDEPSYIRNGPRPTDDPYTVYTFLGSFGRGDRNTTPRTNNGSIVQALSLFNSEMIINRIEDRSSLAKLTEGALDRKEITPQVAIERIYLNTIARKPTTEEIAALVAPVNSKQITLEDLQWALFNRVDFVYNY